MKVVNSITELIGETPILRINRLTKPEDATVYVKLEGSNIGGSVKDRVGKYLLEYADAAGKLNRNKCILEATSGNTGIALAMVAAVKGYPICIVMSESVSIERRKLIKAYGANLILSPGEKGTTGAIELKQRMLEEMPEKYIDIDQFRDPANILAHYQTLGREILEQLGHVDTVVVGIGTGGTGVGVSLRLKEDDPETRVVGVTPELGVDIQGLRNPEAKYPTKLYRAEAFDEVVVMSRDDAAKGKEVARKVARMEGLLIGISAGAILYQALKEAKKLGRGHKIVAIMPDSGLKYLSTDLFS